MGQFGPNIQFLVFIKGVILNQIKYFSGIVKHIWNKCKLIYWKSCVSPYLMLKAEQAINVSNILSHCITYLFPMKVKLRQLQIIESNHKVGN